jgi:hypothetical protein
MPATKLATNGRSTTKVSKYDGVIVAAGTSGQNFGCEGPWIGAPCLLLHYRGGQTQGQISIEIKAIGRFHEVGTKNNRHLISQGLGGGWFLCGMLVVATA